MPEPRYFVDDRVGCVAVRDRQHTDLAYQGLHPDTEGVVRFWCFGREERTCPTCGHATSDWTSGKEEVAEAHALADKLNTKRRG